MLILGKLGLGFRVLISAFGFRVLGLGNCETLKARPFNEAQDQNLKPLKSLT